MTVEHDAVLTYPAEERDCSGQLVDDDDVEWLELATRGPGCAGFERGGARDEKEGEEGTEEGEVGEVEESRGEEEGDGEVQLAQDGADYGETSKDGGRDNGCAQDVDLERAYTIV